MVHLPFYFLFFSSCGLAETRDWGKSSNPPVADFNFPSAQVGVPLLMRHQKHGVAPAVDGEQQLHDLIRRLFVEVPGGLVGKENHRVVDQGAGDATRCLCPPDSSLGRCFRRFSMPKKRASSRSFALTSKTYQLRNRLHATIRYIPCSASRYKPPAIQQPCFGTEANPV